MSGSRKVLFLALSTIIHVIAVLIIAYLANYPEKVYENIEITSYVTPTLKSNVEIPAVEKRQKMKTETVKPVVAVETTDSKSSETSEEVISEQPANDSEITTPAKLVTSTIANRTEAARKADYSGVSQIELTIGSDGLVKKVKLRNSLPYGLDEVALRIAQESKFKPAMINSKPVASAILFKVRFESER